MNRIAVFAAFLALSALPAFSEPVDVAIYAHGGLTDEETAARTASKWIPALYDAKIFPIFFMWETDLHLWTRKAKEIEISCGGIGHWRRRLAARL